MALDLATGRVLWHTQLTGRDVWNVACVADDKTNCPKDAGPDFDFGATPVLVTSMNRRNFDESGKVYNTLGDYPEAVRQLAREQNLPLIDLNAMSKPLYESWSRDRSKLAFAPGDNTHHNDYGSYELASCVVEGIRQNKLELAKFLADDVAPFDPAHPDALNDFHLPASPRTTASTKPEGS